MVTIGFLMILYLGVIVSFLASMWTVFSKAGQPGWASIVPIYNAVVLLRIAVKPWWWVFLMLIPLVNIIFVLLVYVAICDNFGKGAGFAVGLLFLPFIFFPILAWSDAQYRPPSGAAGASMAGQTI